MRKIIALIMVVTLLAVFGCDANDPLRDDSYTIASHIRLDGSGNGGYLHEYQLDAINLSPGGSGSTQVQPNVSSLGGYRLDAINEYLYFTTHVESDWDGITDGYVEVYFEVNVDNTGGLDTDTVKFQLECWHKILGELTNTVRSQDGNTVVGKSDQHELFRQVIPVTNLRNGEVIALRLNLNTILGDVTNVIVNYVEFKYQSLYPAMET